VRRYCLAALLLAALAATAGCARPPGDERTRVRVEGGDPEYGLRLIRGYGCAACHIVPGIRESEGLVGPPLVHWSRRVLMAGSVPNTPENLVLFLHAPATVSPGTGMPDVGASPEDARHMAAYLFTLD
jgi:cytochrome c2